MLLDAITTGGAKASVSLSVALLLLLAVVYSPIVAGEPVSSTNRIPARHRDAPRVSSAL